MIPGQPNLSTKMITSPMRRKGMAIIAKITGPLSYITLKSFERMLVIFPTSWELTVY